MKVKSRYFHAKQGLKRGTTARDKKIYNKSKKFRNMEK